MWLKSYYSHKAGKCYENTYTTAATFAFFIGDQIKFTKAVVNLLNNQMNYIHKLPLKVLEFQNIIALLTKKVYGQRGVLKSFVHLFLLHVVDHKMMHQLIG